MLRKNIILFMIFLCGNLWPGFSLALDYENQRIHQVRIQGNKVIADTAIKNQLKTKAKKRLKKSLVIQDVKNVFKLGYFNNIFVKAVKNKKGRLIVTFFVEEKARIDSILYEGNDSVSEKKLKEWSQLKEYEFLDIKKLKNAIHEIQKGYEKKGYFLAKVFYNVKKEKDPQKIKLIISIKEGEKALIQKIHFIGNKNISSRMLKRYLSNREKGLFSFLTGSGIYQKENLQRDIKTIRQLYFEQGYLEIQIADPEIQLLPGKDGLYMTYFISEGKEFKTGQMDFSGDLILSRVELRKNLPLETGDKLVYSKLQQSLMMIQTKYGDLGYAFANVIPRFAGQDDVLHIMFDIQKGQKTHIRRINISGNHLTRDKVIRRMIDIGEGELYNASQVAGAKRAIQRLGYIEEVDILNKPLRDREIDLEVSLKEREHFGVIQAGGGYNGAQGIFANVEFNRENLFGLGVTTGLQMHYFPGRDFLFNAHYTDPYFLNSKWYFGMNLFSSTQIQKDPVVDFFKNCLLNWFCFGDKKEKKKSTPSSAETNAASTEEASEEWEFYREFFKDRMGVQLDFGRWLSSETKVVSHFGIEKVYFRKVSDPLIFKVSQAEGWRTLLGGFWEYDSRDDQLFPTKGISTRASVEWVRQMPYSDRVYTNDFVQMDYVFKVYKHLKWGIVLKNSIQYGLIRSLKGHPVPFDRLYLLGGQSLRGFKPYTVGQKKWSEKGEGRWVSYGGRQKALYNLELQFPLIPRPRIYGLVFFDMGYADDSIKWSQLKKNVGAGLFIFTPLGPVGVHIGFPIRPSREMKESWYEFQFKLGVGL